MPLPPEVQALVVGLLTNALSAIGQATFRAAVAEGTTDERSVERFAAQTLSGSLVLDAVARDLEEPEGLPDELLDAARTVLQMPDTQSVVHEVLTLRLLEVPDREVDQARAGLAGTVRWACPWLDQARSVELEGLLFGLLDRGCRALVEHLDSADTVTRASIQQLAGLSALTATVRSLERHVASLADRGAATAQGWSAYTEEYVNQVVQRHGWLTLPDFEIERRIEVNALYVEPTIWATDEAHISTVEDLVQRTVRSVLLGNPGGGKSTLASVLAFRVATSGSRVPFVVVLREYGPDYVDGLSIVQHLEKVLNTRYQAAPPEGWVEGVLLAGNGVLIFDGLDELVETTKRREIKNAVEAFCERFPQVRVLVTSRKIGYEQAPLSPHRFTLAHLDEFGNGAVERYAQLWFEHSLPHLSPTERSDRAAGFLRESESVEELRSNPLLLSLMCVLYRGSNYIPESRLDLYEECAKLLFIKWDRSRDIEVPLEIGPDISAALMHLAHWILAEGHFSSGVTESELVRQCTQYLRQRRYEDDLRAEEVAREFVQFCRGRAWVLAEAGTSAVGERLYTFTHRTFLEYYAAFHLARTSGEPEQLASELAPRLARSEWDVVGQLALQMANKQRDLGADRFLNALLDSTFDEFGSEHLAILRFAADSLQYAVPSPSTVRRITAGCIAAALAVDQATGDEFFDPASAKPPLAFALGSLPHSRPVVASQLSRDISGLLADVDVPDRTAARAYAICSLPFVIAEPPESRSEEAYTFWQEWTARELGDRPWQDRFYADEGLAAMGALEVGRLSISDFLARHDARALYDGPRDAGLGVRRVGTLSLLTGWLSGFFAGYLFQVESVDRLLVELEPALRSRGLPLVGAPPAFGLLLSPEGARDRVHGVDGAALGGVVLLFCMDLEGPDPVPAIPGGQPGPHPAVRLAYALAAVRRRAANGEQVSIEDIDEESRRFFRLLDEDVRVLLLRWAEGQQSFWSLSVGGSPGIEDDPDHESRDAGPSEAPGSLLAIPEGSELDV